MIKIENGKIICSDEILTTNLYIKNGKIFALTDDDIDCDTIIDAKGAYVSPGFIDTHVHGGADYDFMDGDAQGMVKACNMHFFHGTTTIIPTTLAGDIDVTINSIRCIKENAEKCEADVWGIHMEGPYFSPLQSGAQDKNHLFNPNPDEYKKLIEAGEGFIKKMSFAPELEGSDELCDYLFKNNIPSFAGHTDASFSDIENAINHGLCGITHFYSCTSTVTRNKGFRTAGVIEAGYYFDSLAVEMIADGCHLPKELINLIYKIKGPDKICLITDAMRGAGIDAKECILGNKTGGMRCIIEDGVAKLPDRSAFAGSIATCDRLVRVCYKTAGIRLTDVVKMMCTTPARVHGIENKGIIKEGYDADILIFDEDINILKIIKRKGDSEKIYF